MAAHVCVNTTNSGPNYTTSRDITRTGASMASETRPQPVIQAWLAGRPGIPGQQPANRTVRVRLVALVTA